MCCLAKEKKKILNEKWWAVLGEFQSDLLKVVRGDPTRTMTDLACPLEDWRAATSGWCPASQQGPQAIPSAQGSVIKGALHERATVVLWIIYTSHMLLTLNRTAHFELSRSCTCDKGIHTHLDILCLVFAQVSIWERPLETNHCRRRAWVPRHEK